MLHAAREEGGLNVAVKHWNTGLVLWSNILWVDPEDCGSYEGVLCRGVSVFRCSFVKGTARIEHTRLEWEMMRKETLGVIE